MAPLLCLHVYTHMCLEFTYKHECTLESKVEDTTHTTHTRASTLLTHYTLHTIKLTIAHGRERMYVEAPLLGRVQMCVHVVHGVKKHRYSRRTKRGEKYLNYASRHHEPPYRNLLYLYRKVYRNRLNINTISPQCQPKRVVDFWFF